MQEFLHSKRFKVLLAVLVVLAGFLLRAAWTGGLSPITAKVLSSIAAPFQKASSAISNSVSGFFQKFVNTGAVYDENEALKKQVQELNDKLVDYDQCKQENDQYKDYLEIKERNPDFTFEPAGVIARDQGERFYSFTIDKGSLDGISYLDPVITADGLVGRIYEVGLTSSKVMTILDISMSISAYDSATRDTGVVNGDVVLSEQGRCKLSLLSKENSVTKGDIVLTSGIGGIYPKGLIIGRVEGVEMESHGMSYYAEIIPTADIKQIKDVLVITSFRGQGSNMENPMEEEKNDFSYTNSASQAASQPEEENASSVDSSLSGGGETPDKSEASFSQPQNIPQNSDVQPLP